MKTVTFACTETLTLAPEDVARQILDLTKWPDFHGHRITLTRTVKSDGKEKTVVESGIYKRTTDGEYLEIHFGLEGKTAPKEFLEPKKPAPGIDGGVWTLKRPAN